MADYAALVLAAGFGSRLLPLTEWLPKPLLPLGDKPLLAHIVQALRTQGVQQILANTHHLADAMARANCDEKLGLSLVHEPEILGTAGALVGAGAGVRRQLLGRHVLVYNGDIWLPGPFDFSIELETDAAVWLAAVRQPRGQGTLGLNAARQVVRLRGQCFGEETEGADYIGIAGLGRACLAELPEKGCLVADFLLPRAKRGQFATVRLSAQPWAEIGSPRSYWAANALWLAAHHNLGTSWVHPSASISDAVTLEHSVVGAGAQVRGSGLVSECVVWPQAVAHAPLRRAIVTPRSVVTIAD